MHGTKRLALPAPKTDQRWTFSPVINSNNITDGYLNLDSRSLNNAGWHRTAARIDHRQLALLLPVQPMSFHPSWKVYTCTLAAVDPGSSGIAGLVEMIG